MGDGIVNTLFKKGYQLGCTIPAVEEMLVEETELFVDVFT